MARVSKGAVALMVVWVLAAWPLVAAARPLAPAWSASPPFSSETAIVTIDGVAVDAEIADTGPLRERGLSYRDGLLPDSGMIFVYESASPRSFWMYEMRFCLDIIWITGGEVVGAAENACPAEAPGDEIPRFASPEPVQFILEVDAGWMDEHGIEAGASVEMTFPDSVAVEP